MGCSLGLPTRSGGSSSRVGPVSSHMAQLATTNLSKNVHPSYYGMNQAHWRTFCYR